ncbi:MAG: HAMP domain-containing protein [Clostridia bacterium]|nr:HAMP domain-containing protein [Clostridia bacterium]
MATSLTGLVSDYLYTQRIRQDSLSVEKLATTLAPLFQSAASDALTEEMSSAAGEMGGRLLIVDTDGKVQFDSFGRMFGMRLELPEVLSILTGGEASAYGIHELTGEDASPRTDGSERYVAYCAAQLIGTRGPLGVLLFVSPVEEMIASLTGVEKQMIAVFVIMAAAAMIAALFFSRVLTRPVSALTATIQKMGKGDLSVRVPVKGSGELRDLAVSYNVMAEQLESLDQSRNQFVSNASHELKTPLTSMKLVVESMLYDPDMPAELRTDFMQDMNHEINRLTDIITDLLTLTRMDNHQVQLNLEQVDATMLTQEAVRHLKPMAEKRGQTLAARIAQGVTLTADASKLRQVLDNLIENAVKYTPDGGDIALSMSRQGRFVVWTVKDNGVGIPAADQAHIFDRFYRVDKARSRETGGTGLGLSIVRQLVTLHGGDISVQSTPGKGSTFTVKIPMTAEEGDA